MMRTSHEDDEDDDEDVTSGTDMHSFNFKYSGESLDLMNTT